MPALPLKILFAAAVAWLLLTPLARAAGSTKIVLQTDNGACQASTDSAGLRLDSSGGPGLVASGVTLEALSPGACSPPGGGSAEFGVSTHVTAGAPAVGAEFQVNWSATPEATYCVRGGNLAGPVNGWQPGSVACTGTSCAGQHSETVSATKPGSHAFSVTCTNARGHASSSITVPTPPVPAPSTPTLSVPSSVTAGVSFDVSWSGLTGAARCVGTGTLNGDDVSNLGDWTSVTTTSSPRRVAVPAGSTGALKLKLTCWNNDNSASSVAEAANIQVGGATACSVIDTPKGQRTRLIEADISYGAYPDKRTKVDVTKWEPVFGYNDKLAQPPPVAWPGITGASPVFHGFKRYNFIAIKFRTPAHVTGAKGRFTNPSYVFGPPITMAISTSCGDFSEHLPTPGCLVENVYTSDDNLVGWKFTQNAPNDQCNLSPNTDYYVNIMLADPESTHQCNKGATTCMVGVASRVTKPN